MVFSWLRLGSYFFCRSAKFALEFVGLADGSLEGDDGYLGRDGRGRGRCLSGCARTKPEASITMIASERFI